MNCSEFLIGAGKINLGAVTAVLLLAWGLAVFLTPPIRSWRWVVAALIGWQAAAAIAFFPMSAIFLFDDPSVTGICGPFLDNAVIWAALVPFPLLFIATLVFRRKRVARITSRGSNDSDPEERG